MMRILIRSWSNSKGAYRQSENQKIGNEMEILGNNHNGNFSSGVVEGGIFLASAPVDAKCSFRYLWLFIIIRLKKTPALKYYFIK